MGHQILQFQYDKIYSYFKTTCEPFDFLEWDGKVLQVWHKDVVIEKYTRRELDSIIPLNQQKN